jgi:hypothetical protein
VREVFGNGVFDYFLLLCKRRMNSWKHREKEREREGGGFNSEISYHHRFRLTMSRVWFQLGSNFQYHMATKPDSSLCSACLIISFAVGCVWGSFHKKIK